MFAQALADAQAPRPEIPASAWSWRAYIYARSGQTANANRAFHELLRLNRGNKIDPLYICRVYLGLKENDLAIAWLERGFAQHSNDLVSLKVSPDYDRLRSDPRFQDMVRRVGLAQ